MPTFFSVCIQYHVCLNAERDFAFFKNLEKLSRIAAESVLAGFLRCVTCDCFFDSPVF